MARVIFVGLAIVVGFTIMVFPPGRESRTSTGRAPGRGSQPDRGKESPGRAQGTRLALGPAAAGAPQDEGTARPEFKAAGVCARCHVVSVLEWGISPHVAAGTDCRKCHGPSPGHVANERNEVKPDRRPRGVQIAKLCQSCHDSGCPKTLETASCQNCHHVHALLDPTRRPKTDGDQFDRVLARWQTFRRHMDDGERRVRLDDWKGARKAFQDALALIPGDHQVTMRLAACQRRLDPVFPGFTIVGDAFDSQTGLPKEVKVVGLDIPMVLIPPGEFDLGSDRLANSRPVHTVAVAAFYLGKFELTQAQWQALMGANPSIHQARAFADAASMPVEYVSWNDCQELIKRLNARVPGGGFRLPTEAEWEYACRAGAKEPLQGAALEQSAWFRANSRRPSAGDSSQSPEAWSPRPVGTKRGNPWGLHDMQGNVSEWCASLYRPYPYDPNDRRESLDAPGMRVVRGGGFADSAEGLDPALRHDDRPQRRYRWNGLRLARGVLP
jgi:formylglycine-generating enzyme required for sulfatase activity